MGLSIQGSIETRAVTLAAINKHIEELNNDFKKKPESIDLSVLNELLKQLEKSNNEIEIRKKAIETKWIGTKCGKWTSRLTIGTLLASTVIAAGTSIYVISKVDCGSSPAPKIMVSFNAVVVAITGVSSVLWGYVTRQEDNLGNMEEEDRFFKRFVAAYEDYRKTTDVEKVEAQFKKCMHTLNEIPENEQREFNIPPKARWIEVITKILKEKDPDSPLANKLEARISNIARKSSQAQSSSFISERAGPNTLTLETIDVPLINEIRSEFEDLEKLLECSVPFISLNNHFYTKDGTVFERIEEVEDYTHKPYDVELVVHRG